jgi:hypothetical protein
MGWIHRDPSIGNILKLKCARPDSSFTSLCSAPPSSSEDNLSLHFASLPAEEAEQKLSQLRQELAASLRQLGGLHECKAIICDFDLSAKLEGYLQHDHEKTREVFVSSFSFSWLKMIEYVLGKDRIHVYLDTRCLEAWASALSLTSRRSLGVLSYYYLGDTRQCQESAIYVD